MRHLAHSPGYTLVELLVALVLLSFIGLAAAGGVQFGTRVWERSASRVEAMRDVATAQELLRTFLASTRPHMADGFTSLEGHGESLDFDAPAPLAFPHGGLARYSLRLVPESGDTKLSLRVVSLIDKSIEREAVFGRFAGELRLSYLDAGEKVPAWLALWRDRDRLPDAIRIASDDTGSGQAWPVLVVRLPVAQDPNCAYDPVSGDCRRS